MKVKTDDTAWSGYDPSKGPPILKAVDKEVKDVATSADKVGEAEKARDIALVRAKKLKIPVVLGSATPSFESINNAHNGKFKQLHLKKTTKLSVPSP